MHSDATDLWIKIKLTGNMALLFSKRNQGILKKCHDGNRIQGIPYEHRRRRECGPNHLSKCLIPPPTTKSLTTKIIEPEEKRWTNSNNIRLKTWIKTYLGWLFFKGKNVFSWFVVHDYHRLEANVEMIEAIRMKSNSFIDGTVECDEEGRSWGWIQRFLA